MTEDNGISRRKALGAIALTGAAAAGSGAGTYAYLSDEASIDSMFQIGSLIIETSPENGELNFEDLGEGEVNDSSISVCNEGTLPVRDVVVTGVDLEGSTEVASAVEVTGATYAGNDVLSSINNGDINGNGIVDLKDVSDYLTNTDVSLESEISGSGLNSSEEGTQCKLLVISTKMDYSVLPDGENNRGVTASVNLIGKQQAPN